MSTAEQARAVRQLRTQASMVTSYPNCKVYDFEDGSFLTIWKDGRTEVNSLTN